MSQWLYIIFKFSGHWVEVKRTNISKYEGGKQRTVKLEKDLLNFIVLKENVEGICPWLQGYGFKLYYHIFGTSPKEYRLIESDVEVLQMIEEYFASIKVEVVVATDEDNANNTLSQDRDVCFHSDMVECNHSYPNSIDVSNSLLDEVNDAKDISVGACFQDSTTFKQALRTTAIINNFGIKIKASDKTRVIATCSYRDCPWRIRASLCADGLTFEVKKYTTVHTCPGINRAGNRLATSSWVAQEIQDIVKKQPNIPPKHIKNSLESTFGLSLPYMKLWRSREVARSIAFGSIDDNYRLVPSLVAELIDRNPGSRIIYTYDSDDWSFRRLYVSFKVCIDGFLAGCRHLIGLDACHLKSKYLGVLLSANSLDGNNGLFTLAFAVVESESKTSWQWFLENLFESLGYELYALAFISDMEKGLGEAIKLVFPNAEHRVCIRHLWKNLKKYFHCPDNHKLRSLVWSTANAYTEHEFNSKVAEIYTISPQIYSYLHALPYKWSKSTFSVEIKNSYNTNNMAESFNSWIGPVRDKPVVDLVDMIRGMIMEQRAERKIDATRWHSELVPHIEEYIREITTRKEYFIIRHSTSQRVEVEGRCDRHEVDLENKCCTCIQWQMTGLPCIHAVAVVGSKEHPLWHTYVDDIYHVHRYRMAYEGAIATLLGKDQWKTFDSEYYIQTPKTLRPRGRPKKNRFKNFLEKNSQKTRNVHKCSRCGLWGHHRTTCKNPLNQVYEDTSMRTSMSTTVDSRTRAKLPIRREEI